MINQQMGYYSQTDPSQVRQLPCYFVQNINEAYNWGIAPGNALLFKDVDGVHVYMKGLGMPYDKPVFEVYTKEQQSIEQPVQSHNTELDALKEEMSKLKDAMRKLNNKIKAGDD